MLSDPPLVFHANVEVEAQETERRRKRELGAWASCSMLCLSTVSLGIDHGLAQLEVLTLDMRRFPNYVWTKCSVLLRLYQIISCFNFYKFIYKIVLCTRI